MENKTPSVPRHERVYVAPFGANLWREFAEICVLPDAEYWNVVSERMQTQNTERDLINEIVPSSGRRRSPPPPAHGGRRDEGET